MKLLKVIAIRKLNKTYTNHYLTIWNSTFEGEIFLLKNLKNNFTFYFSYCLILYNYVLVDKIILLILENKKNCWEFLLIIFFSLSLLIEDNRQDIAERVVPSTWNEEAIQQLIFFQKKYSKEINDKVTKKKVVYQIIADALKPWVSYLEKNVCEW